MTPILFSLVLYYLQPPANEMTTFRWLLSALKHRGRPTLIASLNRRLVISAPTVDEEAAADALYGSGCDDGTFGVSGGVYEIEFGREAASLQTAVMSAIDNVNKAGIGSRVVRVIPNDLVNAASIAERTGKSRQAVRFWTIGERGESFPPLKALVGQSPVWSWVAVARWLHGRGDLDQSEVEYAETLAQINRDLEERAEPTLSSRLPLGSQ